MKIKELKVKLKYGCFFVSLHANHSTNNRNIKEKMKRISMMAVAHGQRQLWREPVLYKR